MTAYILTLQYFRINLKYRNCGSKSIKKLSYQSADLRGLYISLQAQKVNNVSAPDQGVPPRKKYRGRSRVQRFRGSKFHSRLRTAFGMHIYEKSVSFLRRNPKFGAKLAITWENEPF